MTEQIPCAQPAPAHTPGPWQCLQAGDGPTKFAVADAEGVSILTIVEEEGHDFAAVYRDEDARLIAAAPELLEALDLMEKAQAQIDTLPMFPTSHATEAARFKLFDARQAARAAIAKATGAQA